MNHYYTLMSCNGLEWIQPPSNESRLPGCYAYYDPPARIVDELNRLVDRIKRLEEENDSMRADLLLWGDNLRLQQRINRLEAENDALRADLLLWNEKEVKP